MIKVLVFASFVARAIRLTVTASKLVGAALFDDGIDVTHILPDGVTSTQDEVIDQLTDRQPGLFGEHFVSRSHIANNLFY